MTSFPYSLLRRARGRKPRHPALDVRQEGTRLVLAMELTAGAEPVGVWAVGSPPGGSTGGGERRLAVPERDGRIHRAELDLAEAAPLVEPGAAATVALQLELSRELAHDDPEVARLLVAPTTVVDDLPGGRVRVRYRAELGRFRHTRLDGLRPVEVEGRRVQAYPARRGILAIEVGREPRPFGAVHVRRFGMRGGVLRLSGRLFTRHGVLDRAELLIKARTSDFRVTRPVETTLLGRETERTGGLRRYRFNARLDWSELLGEDGVSTDVHDAWMLLWTAHSDEPHQVRVGRTRFLVRYLSRPGWARRDGVAAAITPYYTFKARKTSFHVNLYDVGTAASLRRSMRLRHLWRLTRVLRRLAGRRPIWLVGELPYKAQDTGYHFFRYLRREHPEIDAYYVVEEDSPEARNVVPLGNVVFHGTEEHVRVTLRADRVLGSHHPDFLYPLRTRAFRRAVTGTKIFLQHGIMGSKWMVPNYGKHVPEFETDLFLVSSERERDYIVRDFGYDPREVVVTGLSRFDSLFADDVEVRRQLLIIPTWRDWLQDDEIYRGSEYHRRWWELLHHPRLHDLARTHGFEIVFCLHPNMRPFTALFSDAPVRVISQGEVEVQLLLKESSMLITDYSSPGLDFALLHRPLAYYQFDRSRFFDANGSHLDLDRDLPGPVVYSADEVLDEIERRATDGFTMEPEYQERADRFSTYRDRGNCDRIFAAVRAARRARRSLHSRVLGSEMFRAAFRVFRSSKAYHPTMRAVFRVLRRLPADDSLVVIESGLGRQYADSPRYLYEELVRRETPLNVVWSYAGRVPTRHRHTRTVRRLSPGWFYALARARYWVNNQNFPHYIVRRPDGVYLQTWHGTPLKRMLNDLPAVYGRDPGYVDRVNRASQQWTHLVSPSPFATEKLRSAFRYSGTVVEEGYPRNDVFHRPDRDEIAEKVRRSLGIRPGTTVVLYAPTFRDDQGLGQGRFAHALPWNLEHFHDLLGQNTVLLLRMHALVRADLEIPERCSTSVLDVSTHPEIQELCLASDVLVTDYSSVLFDYANLRRPMVFYAYDLESYRDRLRGFYLDYERDLPGPVVTTEEALHKALSDLEAVAEEYREPYERFVSRFCPYDDGSVSERIVTSVFGPPPARP